MVRPEGLPGSWGGRVCACPHARCDPARSARIDGRGVDTTTAAALWGRRPRAGPLEGQEPDDPEVVEAFEVLEEPDVDEEPVDPEVLEDEPDVLDEPLSPDEPEVLVLLEEDAGLDELEDEPEDFFELLSVR